ncbi:hypothetical protein L7F22_017570 [Adiantum nelumboides]|nr:hypothetical protein [Adiantum nelumboides]
MASGGVPHQPLPAAFLAHLGKDSVGHGNVGSLESRGPATASTLPPPEIHPRHLLPDERDAFISWLRGEFAAANAIIDAMCHHLRMIGEPTEYDFLFSCIQQRRYNWTLVLHMQQFFSVAEVIYALQQATWRRQQAQSLNPPLIPHRSSMEDLKDPRAFNLLRGLKGEVPNVIPQTEVSVSDMAAVINQDLSLSDLSISQEILSGKRMQSPVPRLNDLEASQNLSKSALDPTIQSSIQVSQNQTLTKSPEGQEIIVVSVSKTSTAAPKPSGFGHNVKTLVLSLLTTAKLIAGFEKAHYLFNKHVGFGNCGQPWRCVCDASLRETDATLLDFLVPKPKVCEKDANFEMDENSIESMKQEVDMLGKPYVFLEDVTKRYVDDVTVEKLSCMLFEKIALCLMAYVESGQAPTMAFLLLSSIDTCSFCNYYGSFGGKLFSTDFTALSKEEQDARLPMIKVSKHFQCWEHVDGNLVNVAEGLELYENVLNTYEASQVASLITELQSSGRRGEFGVTIVKFY